MNKPRQPAPVPRKWRWLRAYYFERCKDILILDGIWPALQDLRENQCLAYFQRDWSGGPNVLIGIGGVAPSAIESKIAARIRAYLEEHPSSGDLSHLQFANSSRVLGRWEGKAASHLIDLQPNNSVRIEKEEPYNLFLRQEALKETARHFLCRSSQFAIEWLRLVRAGALQRQHIALHAMIALAWVADSSRLRSHISFGSHAWGFFKVADVDGRLQQVFSDCYAGQQGAAIREFVGLSIGSLARGASPVPGIQEFITLLRETLSDIYTGLLEGRYQPTAAKESIGPAFQNEPEHVETLLLVDEIPGFRAWQITISLLYQVLNQLGIQPFERFLACYLLSRAFEEIYGERAEQILGELKRTHSHTALFSFFAEVDRQSPGSDSVPGVQQR